MYGVRVRVCTLSRVRVCTGFRVRVYTGSGLGCTRRFLGNFQAILRAILDAQGVFLTISGNFQALFRAFLGNFQAIFSFPRRFLDFFW